jgi:hypothetical protein
MFLREGEATVIVRRTTDKFEINADCQSDDSIAAADRLPSSTYYKAEHIVSATACDANRRCRAVCKPRNPYLASVVAAVAP